MTEPMTPEMPQGKGQLDREAADWFARMRGPDAELIRPKFEQWLSLGALHLAAYNRAGELWSLGKFLSEEQEANTTGRPVSVRATPVEPDAVSPPSTRFKVARSAALATAMLVVLLIAGWTLPQIRSLIWPAQPKAESSRVAVREVTRDDVTFETAAGETRALRLADGSTVTLRPLSRLRVMFDRNRRRLDLDRGGARFDVAHEARAFVVAAGDGTVTAHGTVFDVALAEKGLVVVKLLQGSISVALPRPQGATNKSQVRWLSPGEAIEFASAAGRLEPSISELVDLSAGATEFDDARLADVVALANRSPAMRLRIDPTLADMRVSGRFRTADPQVLAGNIAATLGLQVHRLDSGEILISPK